MKRLRDPNGIRTRVTAVKARCPRPLDDREIKARWAGEQHVNGMFAHLAFPRARRTTGIDDCYSRGLLMIVDYLRCSLFEFDSGSDLLDKRILFS